jgi:hypothetical protein
MFLRGSYNIITLDKMQELGHLILSAVSKGFEVQHNPGESLIHKALSLGLYPINGKIEATTSTLLGKVSQGRRFFSRETLALSTNKIESVLYYQIEE